MGGWPADRGRRRLGPRRVLDCRAMLVYIGTTTGSNRAKGIGVFRMDAATGALTHIQTVEAQNPSFLALRPDGKTLYAATRGSIGGAGYSAIEAFRVDATSGTLSPVNTQPSGGQSPAYVSVHPSGTCVFAANYGSGHAASLPVAEDGSLGAPASVYLHEGYEGFASPGPDARRQDGPHAHFIASDPAGERVLACDLGCDRVFVYRVDPAAGTMSPNDPPYAQLPSGAGPRHLSFRRDGRFVYVINELVSTLSAFEYDAGRGTLRIVDTRSTLPDDFTGSNSTAQVVVHPNGRFVYGSNRGHDSIAVFEIHQETGRLTPRGHVPTQGKTPRNFNIDPSGTLLLAANQDSDSIVPFRIDAQSGELTPTGHVTQTPAPVCIVFAPGT